MKIYKDGFKTREEAKEYLKRVRADGWTAKIIVDKKYGEYDEKLPYVVLTYDFRENKHALTESYKRIVGKKYA